VLEPAVCVGAANIDNAGSAVDVALLDPEQLGRSEPGRSREDHHRPVHRPELRGDRFDLPPRLERPLLLRPSRRVRDTEFGRVEVEQSPADSAVEHLPKSLRGLEAVTLRNADRHAYTSRGDRSANRFSPSSAVALPSSQRSFAIVTGAA
jgi:hypothetical protein